jgi:hypothetical protein
VSPLAHVGHWAVNLLYVGPVLIAVLALLVSTRLHRSVTDEEKDEG